MKWYLWVIDDLGTRCYCNVNTLFIMQRRCPIAIDYVNLGWLNPASWPLSSIVIGYANYGMICVIHITDMVKCRLDDIVMCEHFIQNRELIWLNVGLMTRKADWYSLCEFWDGIFVPSIVDLLPRSHCSVNILSFFIWMDDIESLNEGNKEKPLILWDALIH
jgi:hypothetical protein